MPSRHRVAAVALAWGLAWGALGSGQSPPVSRRASQAASAKMDDLFRNSLARRVAPRRVSFTETELNSFLAHDAVGLMMPGVTEVRLSLHGAGRVSGRAVVDLDAVRGLYGSGRWTDPLSYIGGRLPVEGTGVFAANRGTGMMAVESASLAGIRIPRAVAAEIIGYATRCPDYPQGVSLDTPFPLPARIRSIEIGRGVAVVVQ